MKIGFKPKEYSNIICFEIPDDMPGKEYFINTLLNCCKSTTEEEVNLIITANKEAFKEEAFKEDVV